MHLRLPGNLRIPWRLEMGYSRQFRDRRRSHKEQEWIQEYGEEIHSSPPKFVKTSASLPALPRRSCTPRADPPEDPDGRCESTPLALPALRLEPPGGQKGGASRGLSRELPNELNATR